jgi:hypothetical protein
LLADIGSSDGAKGIIVLAMMRHTHGCLGFGFYQRLPTLVTCTADGGEVAVKIRQWRARTVEQLNERVNGIEGMMVKLWPY